MNVEINWLAVLVTTLVTMILGSVWYNPKTFAPLWEKLARINKRDQWPVPAAIAAGFVVSLVTVYVMAHMIFIAHTFFHNSFLQDALMTSLWVWVGFVASRLIMHDTFEGRPVKLTLLNLGHEAVVFAAIGVLLGLFGV